MKNTDDGEGTWCFTLIVSLLQHSCWCESWPSLLLAEGGDRGIVSVTSQCLFVCVTPQCLFVCVIPQCLFLCQAGCVLAHPTAVADAVECPELCSCSGQLGCHCSVGNCLGVWPQWVRKTEKQANPQVVSLERMLDIC